MADRMSMIANQMIKGCNAPLLNAGKAASDEDLDAFKERHKELIEWVDEHAPPRINAGVLGVIGKAALWYGKEKAQEFCERISKIQFKGEFDPCHVLWLYLLRLPVGKGRDTTEVYRRAVTVMRAFLEDREIKGAIRPCKDDIFEWDRTYTRMRRIKRNQHQVVWEERCALEDKDLGEEIRIAAEIEEALQILRNT